MFVGGNGLEESNYYINYYIRMGCSWEYKQKKQKQKMFIFIGPVK